MVKCSLYTSEELSLSLSLSVVERRLYLGQRYVVNHCLFTAGPFGHHDLKAKNRGVDISRFRENLSSCHVASKRVKRNKLFLSTLWFDNLFSKH